MRATARRMAVSSLAIIIIIIKSHACLPGLHGQGVDGVAFRDGAADHHVGAHHIFLILHFKYVVEEIAQERCMLWAEGAE